MSSQFRINRRNMFLGMMASGAAAAAPAAFASGRAEAAAAFQSRENGVAPQKIASVECIEYHGHYETEAGINGQWQVNPQDIYEDANHYSTVYQDKPSGKSRTVKYEAIYVRIKTESGLEGIYGPIEKEYANVVVENLKPFILGKDALANEVLWDKMYRSNRHSRSSFFLMGISAIDNAIWDLKGKYYGVPVYRLLGGPSRSSVECYVSCLGFSLEPDAVRKRSVELKNQGYRYQKWFMGYGPGAGPEGMKKNVELVRVLRESLGDECEIMFDAFSGWDQTYALEWAHQVEKYRPRWMEEVAHPEKIGSFANARQMTTIPIASGEHFYGRWEAARYLQANALQVVQADPEWCGGISELLKIGTIASVYDVPVIPHGHSIHAALHTVASQSPMTFPLCEYLFNKMQHYYHFEKNPPTPVKAHLPLPTAPGFGIEIDAAKVDSQKVLTAD